MTSFLTTGLTHAPLTDAITNITNHKQKTFENYYKLQEPGSNWEKKNTLL